MRKCPVCDQYNKGMLCDNCGFDGSRDYEHNPTLQKLSAKIYSISHLRKTAIKAEKAQRKAAAKEGKAQRKAVAKAEKTSRKTAEKEETVQPDLTVQETQLQQSIKKKKKKMSKGWKITLIVLAAILGIQAITTAIETSLAKSAHFDNYEITMGSQDHWTELRFDTVQNGDEVVATVTFKINQEYSMFYRTPAISLISKDGNITLKENHIADPTDPSKYIYQFTIDETVPNGTYICTVDQLLEFGLLPASRAVATLYIK